MKKYKNLTPFAQYYIIQGCQYPIETENILWILDNQHLFKDLKKGERYVCFENEKPILYSEAQKISPKTTWVAGERINRRLSPDGNAIQKVIAICECGAFKASKTMNTSDCSSCLIKKRNIRQRDKALKKKAGKVEAKTEQVIKKPEKLTVKEIAFQITGDYQRIFREEYVPDVFDLVEEGRKIKLKT